MTIIQAFRFIKQLNAWKGSKWATRKQFKAMARHYAKQCNAGVGN